MIIILINGSKSCGWSRGFCGTLANAESLDEWRNRCLAFDRAAAEALPELTQRARAAGRPMSLIGAIAVAHGFSVATRDTGPFEAAGIGVINPWNS